MRATILGVRDIRVEDSAALFSWPDNRVYKIRSVKEAVHGRFFTRAGKAPHRPTDPDLTIGRFPPRFDYRHPRALWQSELSLPQAGRARPWSQPAFDLQGGGQDHYRELRHTGISTQSSARTGRV